MTMRDSESSWITPEALRVQHGLKKVVYGMEPTANYHKPLGEYLITLGRTVVLVSGVTVSEKPGVIGWAVGQA